MPSNKFSRGSFPPKKSVAVSQRSTCAVAIYPWEDSTITKLQKIDLTGSPDLNNKTGNTKAKAKIIILNDVISCTINKSKEGSSGSFSITLKKGLGKKGTASEFNLDYLKIISPGDWITIHLKNDGILVAEDLLKTTSESGFKFLGIVEDVRAIEIDSAEGVPKLEYIVSGKDWGSIFDSQVFFNPSISKQASTLLGTKFLENSNISVKGKQTSTTSIGISPDAAIKKLIGFYLGGTKNLSGLDSLNVTNQTWFIPKLLAILFKSALAEKGSPSVLDILNMTYIGLQKFNLSGTVSTSPLLGGALFTALPTSGSVWSILQFALNSIVNEMFTELCLDSTGSLVPTLVARQIPFSNKIGKTNVYSKSNNLSLDKATKKTFFIDLPKLTVWNENIKQKSIGKSSHERINHIFVVPKIQASGQNSSNNLDLTFKSILNVASIQRYGLKTYTGQTPFIYDSSIGDPSKICDVYNSLIADWFFLAHEYYNGIIVVEGLDEYIRAGDNLYIPDQNQLFHIEGYTHNYQIAPNGIINYETTIRVSRGQIYDGTKSDFISNAEENTTIVSTSLEGTRKF